MNLRLLSIATKRARGVLLLIGLCASVQGCGAVIVPPPGVRDPVLVHVIDYGDHSSLLMPNVRSVDSPESPVSADDRSSERMIEYAYGDWNWFALDRTDPLTGFIAAVFPTQGALGRAERDVAANTVRALQAVIAAEHLHSFHAERAAVRTLLRSLEERHAIAAAERSGVDDERAIDDALVWSAASRMWFAPDQCAYHLLHTCNDQTAQWLVELGCRVTGCTTFADFRFKAPATDSERDPG